MRISVVIISLLCLMQTSFAQKQNSFCKAVEKGNFKKAERIFKLEINKRKLGTQYDNGPGSGMQTTHQYNLDTLTNWLKNQPCVEDAYWDRCEIKISIYPGWTVIGAKFKTSEGIKEKCFHIQEGTMGYLKIFCWRPHILKAKNILVYKKMYDCEGFIEKQKRNCKEIKK